MNKEFFDYYNRGREFNRNERCIVEFHRTKEILSRYILSPNSTILDMGGGAGYYYWDLFITYEIMRIELVLLEKQNVFCKKRKSFC